jgi:hypothetical protein
MRGCLAEANLVRSYRQASGRQMILPALGSVQKAWVARSMPY